MIDTARRALAAAASLVAAASVAQCNTAGGTDAGVGPVVDSGVACGPIDVTGAGYDGGTPEVMRPPHPARLGACTPQQVDAYAQCQGAKDLAECAQFAKGGASAICGTCIESQHDAIDGGPAPSWGVVVFDTSTNTASFNVEGCVDDALGQVTDELANGGRGSCGDLLHASYGCQEAACSACGGSPIDSCGALELGDAGGADATSGDAADDAAQPLDAGAADAGCARSDFAQCAAWAAAPGVECSVYDARVSSPTGPCAPLFGDAAPPDVSACFPDPSYDEAHQQQQEIDWLRRIVGYMCGSG